MVQDEDAVGATKFGRLDATIRMQTLGSGFTARSGFTAQSGWPTSFSTARMAKTAPLAISGVRPGFSSLCA